MNTKKKRSTDAFPKRHVSGGRAEVEIVFALAAKASLCPHRAPSLIDGLLEGPFFGTGLDLDRQAEAGTAHAEHRMERDHDKGVLILPQHRADAFESADHEQGLGSHADGLPDRVEVGEQLFDQLVADDANARPVAVLRIGKETAALDDQVADVDHTGGLPAKTDVGQLLILAPHGHGALSVCPDVGAQRAASLESLDVGHADIGMTNRSPVLIMAGGGEGHFPDAKHIRTEIGYLVLDIAIGSEDERNHHDQHGDAHRQAEHRQRGAQPMVAHRVEGQNQVGA